MVEVLSRHGRDRPTATAYTFLDGEREVASRSYAALDARARVIASWLTRSGMTGKLVLLLVGDGIAFIEAFMGCLYAGVVAVPAAVPHPKRPVTALVAIGSDAEVAAILTRRSESAPLELALAEALPRRTWLYLEDASSAPDDWSGRAIRSADLAFVQYTSGSTGRAKGVAVTHGNLIANQVAIKAAMRLSSDTVFAGWLPLFHDMGLIGNVLQTMYLGVPCVLMPPIAFLQKPVRWLAAISTYRATISGAPNFAFDLCVARTSPEARANLDLSCWRVAFNGSEPVRPDTLQRFSAAFAPAGFDRRAFYPCYGMAEATLLVAGVEQGAEPVVVQLDPPSLAQGRAVAANHEVEVPVRAVGCGRAVLGTRIVVVDPSTSRAVPANVVGEIWIEGDGVAAGYYRKPTETKATFGAMLATGEGPFLRSGDLGFLAEDGQLFIVGRSKDVIIVRGRKHHPSDLEATAQRSSSMLETSGGAAFTLDDGTETSIAIVHELTRAGWSAGVVDEITADVREAIANEHGLAVSRVVLIKPRTLPRTTSGKVRRSVCREMLNAGAFETLPAPAPPPHGRAPGDTT